MHTESICSYMTDVSKYSCWSEDEIYTVQTSDEDSYEGDDLSGYSDCQPLTDTDNSISDNSDQSEFDDEEDF